MPMRSESFEGGCLRLESYASIILGATVITDRLLAGFEIKNLNSKGLIAVSNRFPTVYMPVMDWARSGQEEPLDSLPDDETAQSS